VRSDGPERDERKHGCRNAQHNHDVKCFVGHQRSIGPRQRHRPCGGSNAARPPTHRSPPVHCPGSPDVLHPDLSCKRCSPHPSFAKLIGVRGSPS
jgi:hypothetical protein